MKNVCALCAGLVLILSLDAAAQIPVTDAGNATINTVTSIQSTISAIEDVLQSAYMLLELTPLDEIALSTEFVETMAQLGEIAAEGAALMKDAQGAAADFEAIFDIRHVDPTPQGISVFMATSNRHIWEARRYAVRTQSLINHVSGAVSHVTRLVQLIGALTGNMQGNQLQTQLLAQANQTLQTQAVQQAAEQRVKVLEGAQRTTLTQAWNTMQYNRWKGWPTLAEVGR